MVTFTAQQRTKKIGVRKVLGATVANVVGLLSKDFLKLVLIGVMPAVPITLYVINQWLENFAYRTTFGVGIFAFSGIVAGANCIGYSKLAIYKSCGSQSGYELAE